VNNIPKYHKSLKTGNLFPHDEYSNHGCGGMKGKWKDLPKDEYPYTIIYEEPKDFWWKTETIK
jgi:hypothetical protein